MKLLYEGKDKQEILKKYDLPSIQTIDLWNRNFKKRLEKGIIYLPDMAEEAKSYLKAISKRGLFILSAIKKRLKE